MARAQRGHRTLVIGGIGVAAALLLASAAVAQGDVSLIAPPPGAQLEEAATGTCPSLVTYYLDDYALGGDKSMRLMGPLSIDGQRKPPRVALWMERGRAGEVTVVMPSGEVREMTPLEFHGRWRSPCDLLGGRQP
jgi:hypothetical protein